MAHDVFISYSSHDKPIADAVCARLEASGIRCWIAPRDVLPGTPYASALVEAIRDSGVMVLVFSSHSNTSLYVMREVERAVAKGIAIVPFRIENILPTGDMEFFLSLPHWLDALSPPIAAAIDRLVVAVKALLPRPEPEPSRAVQPAGGADVVTNFPVPPAVPQPGRTGERRSTLETYIQRVREESERTFANELVRPDRVYVPQHAATIVDPPVEVELAHAVAAFWGGRPSRFAVVGNYGMGKTYFTWRATLAQIDRLDREREQLVPILFPLRRFNYADAAAAANPRDIVRQVLDHAMALEFPGAERRQFVRWLEDGVVGVILDGLDELSLPRGIIWREAIQPLLDIDGARVLMTSRTSYLQRPAEELKGFTAYELLPWADREWRRYVELSPIAARAGAADALLAAVAARPKLASLTTRPLWCYMIVSIFDRIPEIEDLALTGLYQQFLDAAVKRRPLMDVFLIYRAMERFADESLRSEASSMDEARLLSLLSRMFESIDHAKLREFITKEVRTYAFLNCDRSRRYSFGHKSFEDYFAAAGAARWLLDQATGAAADPHGLPGSRPFLLERRLTDEQAGFLAGILREERIQRSLEMLPESRDARLSSRVLMYLTEMLSREELDRVLRANLFRMHLELLRTDSPGRCLVNGLRLTGANLAGMDLSRCTFDRVDFTDVVLSGARFNDSRFSGCTFFGATLDGADFTGADLSGADLRGIELGDQPPLIASARGLDAAQLGARERRLLFN